MLLEDGGGGQVLEGALSAACADGHIETLWHTYCNCRSVDPYLF